MKKIITLCLILACTLNTQVLPSDEGKNEIRSKWQKYAKPIAKIAGGVVGASTALAIFNDHAKAEYGTNLINFYAFDAEIEFDSKLPAFLLHTPAPAACIYLIGQGLQELIKEVRSSK